MAFRSDITVDWSYSPRIIWVHWTDEASRELALQDLVDTIRTLESQRLALDDFKLIDAVGKTALVGGQEVAITVTLRNALVAFDPNNEDFAPGTATADNATGTILDDSTAHFIDDGVIPGCVVDNVTDHSSGTVLAIRSQTRLITTPLYEGITSQWHIGDEYHVHENLGCSISGGNLTALDILGNSVFPPFLPTERIYVTLALSSSATLIPGTSITKTDVTEAVWDAPSAAHDLAGTFGTMLALCKRLQVNRLELTPGSTNNWILYKDNDTDPLLTWNVTDPTGNAITIATGTPARRTRGV